MHAQYCLALGSCQSQKLLTSLRHMYDCITIFRDISCVCLVPTWIYLPRLMNIGRYGYGMTNLFRNTAVTSVSVLQENCDGVKIFYPKLYICIFYSKANKSKLKKNIIFFDIFRKKLQWPVTQLGPFNKEQTECHFLHPECFFWFILW